MAVNRRHLEGLSPEDVWAVLADGSSYGDWVVGTRAVREVTGDWPAAGTGLHYVVGRLPLRKNDVTRCLESEAPRHLVLEARTWPVGTVHIALTLDRGPHGCLVTIEEHPKTGVLKTLHNPLIDAAIRLRNVECLRRLERLARERSGQPAPSGLSGS
jgi:hypothetical protein